MDRIYPDAMIKITCPLCQFVLKAPDGVPEPIVCACGSKITAKGQSFDLDERMCDGCDYRVNKGCVLYLNPCTLKRLWAGQIDPPEKCPRREQFV